jgi:POT family proton-dependent oligopeptide transporter
MGVNLGGFLAPIGCGTVGEIYGWHWGFTVAGIGMVTGLLTYIGGSRYLPRELSATRTTRPRDGDDCSIEGRTDRAPALRATRRYSRHRHRLPNRVRASWQHLAALDRAHEPHRRLLRHSDDLVSIAQSTRRHSIYAVSRVHWLRLARKGREPSSITKMAMGAGVVAVSYAMLAGVAAWSDHTGTPATWLWLVAFFIVMTVGELYILAIGFGLFGRLAPNGFTATSIALWFSAGVIGNLTGGATGALWSRLSAPAFFLLIGAIAGASGLLLLFFDASVRQQLADE